MSSLVRCFSNPKRIARALKPLTTPVALTDDDDRRTVPHIPREFAKDTIEFFRQSSPHVKSLLDLVFSARAAPENLSIEDQEEFDRMTKEFKSQLEKRRAKYMQHEEKARALMFEAIRNLPEDLYDEAVGSGVAMPPSSLQFHEMYKEQLMSQSMSDWELVKMQTFANLMHIRYSHSEAKNKHPDRFFISESAALNLRKERAKKEKGI